MRQGGPQSLSVRIGISDGSVTEIVEGGLQEGDQVITDLPQGDSGAKPGGPSPGGSAFRVRL
jgi:hypothetical protein